MQNVSETELVAQAVSGNRFAFEELAKQNYMLVYKISYKYCGFKEEAEDITQEVFCKLGSAISRFKGESSFKTWLYSITANAAKDYLRKNKRRNTTDAYDESLELQSGEVGQDDALYQKQLLQSLAKLPPKLREALILVYSEDLSHAEAAKIAGCSEGTISWRIHEARKTMLKIKEKVKLILSWLF